MGGHLLGDLQLAAVLEISRDAGGAKGVAADLGLDPGRERPPAQGLTKLEIDRMASAF
jgi:hypothetical protein